MGYSIGLVSSALTFATIIGIIIIVSIIVYFIFGYSFNTYKSNNNLAIAFVIGGLIIIIFSNLLIYVAIFLFIFFYTKGISNPNQPYNTVFMFIAGYLLPPFALIYFFFILASVPGKEDYNYGEWRNFTYGFFILCEFFILFFMMELAGIIMLCMLHHRKVNKSILYILLICHFLPAFSFLIGYFFGSQYLLLIPNMVLNLMPFGFGIFFYCKYANIEYPKSELLNPNDM